MDHCDLDLPEDIIDALVSAAQEVNAIETWLPPRQGVIARVVPRAIRLLNAALIYLPEKLIERRTIRQNVLHMLAYTRADIRLMTIFDIALNSPEALHDLISGPIDPEYAPHRYNLVTTLGIFARHGLISGIANPKRIDRAERAIEKARRLRKNLVSEGEQE